MEGILAPLGSTPKLPPDPLKDPQKWKYGVYMSVFFRDNGKQDGNYYIVMGCILGLYPPKGSKTCPPHPNLNPVLHRGNQGIIRGFHFMVPLGGLGYCG